MKRDTKHASEHAPWSNVLLLVLLVGSIFISPYLPVDWGWENGAVENAQVLVLLLGMATAIWGAQFHGFPVRRLWVVASLFWLAMAGRELAWGAAFWPESGFSPESGPIITSRILWYRPAVPWILALMLAWVVYAVLRYRLISRVVWPWCRQRLVPWTTLALFVLAMLVSAHAEGHALLGLPVPPEQTAMVLEEVAEFWAYVALFWAQWQLVMLPRDEGTPA